MAWPIGGMAILSVPKVSTTRHESGWLGWTGCLSEAGRSRPGGTDEHEPPSASVDRGRRARLPVDQRARALSIHDDAASGLRDGQCGPCVGASLDPPHKATLPGSCRGRPVRRGLWLVLGGLVAQTYLPALTEWTARTLTPSLTVGLAVAPMVMGIAYRIYARYGRQARPRRQATFGALARIG